MTESKECTTIIDEAQARCECCGEAMDKEEMRGDNEDGYRCYCCIADFTATEVFAEESHDDDRE